MLTEAEKKSIIDDFREIILLENTKYNKLRATSAHPIDLMFARLAAEACAKSYIKERERAKELLEGLKNIRDCQPTGGYDNGFYKLKNIARDILTNYQNSNP